MKNEKDWPTGPCATTLDPILARAVRRGFYLIRLTNEGGLTRAEQRNGTPTWKKFHVIHAEHFDGILSEVRWLAGISLDPRKPVESTIIEHARGRFRVTIARVQFFQIAYLTLQPA